MNEPFDKPVSNYKKNFAIMIPHDICRHPDGTATTWLEDRDGFVVFVHEKGITDEMWEMMSGKEKEVLKSEFREIKK